jgi:hemoglobin-like flavoprotein
LDRAKGGPKNHDNGVLNVRETLATFGSLFFIFVFPPPPTIKEKIMTPIQKTLVQSSFAKVAPIAQTAAELFYGRLFELDPALRSMFKGDMATQGQKLMSMIGIAVRGLDDLDALVPVVQSLGIRHVGYGVRDTHYGTVGEALLWTLEKGLGPDFTPAVKDAWATVYTLLADTMKSAAAEHAA